MIISYPIIQTSKGRYNLHFSYSAFSLKNRLNFFLQFPFHFKFRSPVLGEFTEVVVVVGVVAAAAPL